MIPDYEKAATQAARALIKFKILRLPVYPQQLLQQSPVATLVSFADLADLSGISRSDILTAAHGENDTALSYVYHAADGSARYLFAFNREKPIGLVRFALAVELGHIYLGHVGYRDNDVRHAEALTFAYHFVYPRAVIQLMNDRGFIFTDASFQRIFGDCAWHLNDILRSVPVYINPELNLLVRNQFTPYVDMLKDSGVFSLRDNRPALNFDKYMAGYKE